MRGVPANALQVGRLPRPTVPDASGYIPVSARIVGVGRERWVRGTAKAWTSNAVCVWWTDIDCLQRIDWLGASDVRRS